MASQEMYFNHSLLHSSAVLAALCLPLMKQEWQDLTQREKTGDLGRTWLCPTDCLMT